MTNKIYNLKNPVSVEDALDWCIMAYAETRANGYFTAYKFKVRCKDGFAVAAINAGLSQDTDNGRVWKNMDHVPNRVDATKLFDAFLGYRTAEKERAKAKRAAKKIQPVTQVESTDTRVMPVESNLFVRLGSLEAKVDKLLELWTTK